jgi:hypothetical protein
VHGLHEQSGCTRSAAVISSVKKRRAYKDEIVANVVERLEDGVVEVIDGGDALSPLQQL